MRSRKLDLLVEDAGELPNLDVVDSMLDSASEHEAEANADDSVAFGLAADDLGAPTQGEDDGNRDSAAAAADDSAIDNVDGDVDPESVVALHDLDMVFEESAPVPAPAAPGVEHSDVHISPLGHVSCSRPEFNEFPTLGLVGWKRGSRRDIFANCHLHPRCSLSRGTATRPITLEHMAQWLASGRVASRSEPHNVRLSAGKEHRDAFRRPDDP